jgi:hypothetical protein
MTFEFIAVKTLQTCPVVLFWNGTGQTEHSAAFLIHLEEEQIG